MDWPPFRHAAHPRPPEPCAAAARSVLDELGAWPAIASRRGFLLPVLATSPWARRLVLRRPEWLEALCAPGALEAPLSADAHVAALAGLATAADEATLERGLREARARAWLRILLRDVGGLALLGETLTDLSGFADAAIDTALAFQHAALVARHGEPVDALGRPQRLYVLALGKLGAGELNFSSDVDLVFGYAEAGETSHAPSAITNQEFFTRLGQRLIRTLSATTPDGFVFRVDMRLRPFGGSGPLVMGTRAALGYYETHARDWERYALVKARVAAGDIEAGAALLAALEPFVYRRYLDFGSLQSLRSMKAMIDEEVRRRGSADDVKRGAGGIREVEFIAQSFQLVRGGREPRLRTRRLAEALAAIEDLGLMAAEAVDALRAAYVFLRDTEHRLQQAEDRQTQRLPTEPEGLARLAAAMGHEGPEDYLAALAAHRRSVRAHFDRLLGRAEETTGPLVDLGRLWSAADDAEGAGALLLAAGFDNDPRVVDALLALRRSPRFAATAGPARARLDRLMPLLLGESARARRPLETLSRVLGLVAAVATRSAYLALLGEHPDAVVQLIRLFAASPWVAEQIIAQPILLDALLDPRRLYAPPGPAALGEELAAQSQKLPPEDEEAAMDLLRQFRAVQVLRVAAADLVGNLPLAEVSNHLTAIAETVVREALARALGPLIARHGTPRVRTAEGERAAGFIVVAYGKLGGLELGYGSDLDLVFLYEDAQESLGTDGPRPLDAAVFYTRLAQRLIHWLQARTAAGRAYEVDARLRPNGSSGLLVGTLKAFETYQHERAWTWEHQALVRARVCAGDTWLAGEFESVRRRVLGRPRDPLHLGREVREMRTRMRAQREIREPGWMDLKQGRGGMSDVEFMVQWSVLRWAATHPQLLDHTDNLRLLETLGSCGLLAPGRAAQLRDAWLELRTEVHRAALLGARPLAPMERFEAERAVIEAAWQETLGDEAGPQETER